MSSSADQAYLGTRVSIMATRLLDAAQIAALVRMQLAELTERFQLAALLETGRGVRACRRAVEQGLVQVLFAELGILVRPMRATERGLMLAWARKYALYNLKTLIRGKLYELDQAEIRETLFDLPPNIGLKDDDLLRAENVLELLRQLEAGPHALIARQAREIYEQRREPFALEGAIDQRYYAGLVSQTLLFRDSSLEPLRRLIGAELDRTALLWLLRFRFSYRLSPSETFYQLVPSTRLLHRERLLKLVNLESFERVLEALPPPLAGLLADCATVIDVQRLMGRYVANEAWRVLRQGRSAVARALAYLMLREMDLRLLFALVQGRLLGLPEEVLEIAMEMAEPSCLWSGARGAESRVEAQTAQAA
jgi:V/A-type H+/Na+-transporting ATPase subunit C